MISKKDAEKIKYFCECGNAIPCLKCLSQDEIESKHKDQIKPSFFSAWALSYKFDDGTRILSKYCWKDTTIDDLPTKVFRTRQHARDARKSCRFKKAKVVKVIISIELLK